MLERTKEALFHGSREGMHERMCTQSRPIVNRTNIISLVGRGDMMSTNFVSMMSVGRIRFGDSMIGISDRGNILSHGRE